MYPKSRFIFAATLVLLCTFFGRLSAQQILPGKKDSINSAILSQKRFIQVVMPENYKPGSIDKFDVIYVLDGDDNTPLLTSIQQFVRRESFMPPAIIVGVLNIDRDKDLTPTHEEGFATSGGADKFLGFLKDELIPYVNKTYPANGENVLFGHSFGGLFVTHALLNHPETFKSYIAADPSYWWGNQYMIKEAAKKLPALTNSEKSLFISGREGQGLQEMGILPMDTLLKRSAPAGLAWKISAYPNETHGTVRLKSIYDGLRFVYNGYSQYGIEFHPMNGILVKDKPIKIWFFDDTLKARYTTNGTTPTLASTKIGAANMLTSPGTFTVKLFTEHEKYDKVATGIFKEGEPLTPVKKARNFKPGGLHYAYYEGQWDKLPDFNKLKPVKEGRTDKDFDVSKMPAENNYGLVISGQIETTEDGYYVFDISSDDGSRLYLGNQLIIDNDGLHDAQKEHSFILPLKKGFYPIRLEYFQKDGGKILRTFYLTPGLLKSDHPDSKKIPQELQYSK